MKFTTSRGATEFVMERGGRLYVWASTTACCGGTRFIEASTVPPGDSDRFSRALIGEFDLFVRPAGPDGFPDELHVDLVGIRRRRVRAYWNGCAYLV